MVRQKMITPAKASYVICTEGKLGKKYYHRLCAADDLTGVITLGDIAGAVMRTP